MSVNIYDKETGELIKIAGNANGNATIDDASSSNKTTYSSSKIEELISNSDFSDNVFDEALLLLSPLTELSEWSV